MSTSDDRAARTAASLSKNPSRLKSTISTFVPSAGVRLPLYQSTTLRIASLSGPGQYTIRTVVGDWPEICAGMINVTAAQRAKTHPLIVRSRIEFPPCSEYAGLRTLFSYACSRKSPVTLWFDVAIIISGHRGMQRG